MSRHRTRNTIEVCRPPAARFELMGRFVKRGVTRGACVGAARGHVFIVGTCVGGFGAFIAKDTELFLFD